MAKNDKGASRVVYIRLPQPLADAVQRIADERFDTVSTTIRHLIVEALQEGGRDGRR